MNAKKQAFLNRDVKAVIELIKKKPMSVQAIADKMHCTKVAAGRRVKAALEMEEYRQHILTRKVREGERGPESTEYFFA